MSSIHNGAMTDEAETTIRDLFVASGYNEQELQSAVAAERDVLGSNNNNHSCQESQPEMQPQEARQGLQEAIAQLPASQRQAYGEAVQQSPLVVDIETPAERFLLVCRYDFWAAAIRMTKYWTERKNVFGPDRFHFPLLLEPSEDCPSALDQDTIEAIQRCSLVILPVVDDYNRGVALHDRDLVNAVNDDRSRLQKIFYSLQCMSESRNALLNGYIVIMAAETPSAAAQAQSPRTDDKAATQGGTPGRNEKESRKQYEPSVGVFKLALEEAVPVQLKCTHSIIVNNPDSQVSSMAKGFMQRTLTAFASSMQQFSFFRLRSRWHRVELGSEPTKLLNQLADYGLSPDHVPQRFGGTAQPRLFLEHRLKLEKERYAPLFQAKVAVAAVANVAVLTNPDECRPSGIDDPLNPIGQKESAVKNQAVASERSVMDDAGVSINPKTSINITSTTTLPKVTKRKRDVMSQWGEDFASRCTISLFGKPNDEIVASSDTSGENDDSKLYSSDTKHLDTATPSHSADVSSNKTDSLVRERVERLVELTEEFEAKRKVAKLSTERDGIEREQKLLDAHLTICQHIARVYEMDHEVIRSILYEVLSPFIPQDDSLDAFVTDVLNHALIFQGRNCLTGRFMLKLNKATPKMTLSEHHWQILGKAQQSLEGVVPSELPDLRNLTKDIVSDNSPGITSAVAVLPGTSAKSIETTKSEEQQLFKEANALTEADQDEKNLSELQGRADRLAQANQKLSSHQKYLESCIIYANHAIEQFQHHQRQRRDILAAAISLIFSSCIFMSGPLAVPSNHFLIKGTRYDPFLVADRLSSKLAWHSGQNPSSVSIVSLTSLLVSEGYVLHSQVERFVAHWQQQDLQTIKNSIIQPVPRYTSEHEKTKQGDLEERTRSGAEQKSTNHSCNGPEERQQRVQRRRKTSLKRL